MLRDEALEACGQGEWRKCVDSLEEARRQDPEGDTQPDIVAARNNAVRHLSNKR
jgi:hypothetical protein